MRRAADLCALLQARQRNDTDLGQHFLTDESHLAAIVQLAGDLNGRNVLEVGPGPGTLTEHLIDAGAMVTAIEVDPVAAEHLEQHFRDAIDNGHLVVHVGDALTHPWPTTLDAIVANIPYQISSPLIERIEAHRRDGVCPERVVLLVQEEFAERLTLASPADRGSLGVCTALGWEASMHRRVPPGAFRPPPAVMSRVVMLEPRPWPKEVDHRFVRLVVHQAFSNRRKKLRTSLQQPPRRLSRRPGWHTGRWRDAIEALGDDPRMDQRPEDFDLAMWVDFCVDLVNAEVHSG
jgi:16S rRNA (adenine1518-N6/adenine1519-N6)-dimethyltransferase